MGILASVGTLRGAPVTLTIPLGGTVSNALSGDELYAVGGLVIYSPAALDATVFSVEVTWALVPGAGDWRVAQSNGVDVVLAAGKSLTLMRTGFTGLRVATTAGVALARLFMVIGTT